MRIRISVLEIRNVHVCDHLAPGMKDFIAVIATELRAQNLNVGFCESEED